jgi:hypothetical protein
MTGNSVSSDFSQIVLFALLAKKTSSFMMVPSVYMEEGLAGLAWIPAQENNVHTQRSKDRTLAKA